MDWCFGNASVTGMAPDTRPWLRAFLLQVQHLGCVGDRCAVGEPESAEEKLSMQKEEEAGCTQLHRKVRNPPAGPPGSPLDLARFPKPRGPWDPTSPSIGFHKETTRLSWEGGE